MCQACSSAIKDRRRPGRSSWCVAFAVDIGVLANSYPRGIRMNSLRRHRSILLCGGLMLAATATAALAGNGVGGVFNLGQINNVSRTTELRGTTDTQQLLVRNDASVGTSRRSSACRCRASAYGGAPTGSGCAARPRRRQALPTVSTARPPRRTAMPATSRTPARRPSGARPRPSRAGGRRFPEFDPATVRPAAARPPGRSGVRHFVVFAGAGVLGVDGEQARRRGHLHFGKRSRRGL